MPTRRRRHSRLPLFLLLLVIVAAGAWFFLFRDSSVLDGDEPVYTVQRGALRATILEGGSLEALESYTVSSQVEGRSSILYIVEEGTVITPEDVAAGKVLVRLDSASIEESLEKQKIDLAQARASYESAVSTLEIQRQQNASDIRTAELDVRFAMLDLARYVGSDLVDDLIATARRAQDAPPASTGGSDDTADAADPEAGLHRLILTLLRNDRLEGEARQTIRQLDSDIGLAEEEFTRAQVEYDWSRKLREKGYVSRDEEEADRLALERKRIELDRARTSREQFVVYDFPKQVEQLLSNLLEAEDGLSRTRKRAESAEAKAVADRDSRAEQLALQEARHTKLLKQLDGCVIRADRPGLVVYASSGRRGRWDRGERIQEGATIQERQAIINIPDLGKLGIRADIHESVVERVKVGQPVTAVVDALPGAPLHGRVTSVAPLPNAAENWFNPDRKVYATTIELDDIPENVRPGMSVQVEILVAELKDAVLIPVQSVAGTADRPVVYVSDGNGSAERPVVLGLTNDRFVQVREGLEVGEQVLLAPPRTDRLAEVKGARRNPAGPPAATGAEPSTEPKPPERSGGGERKRPDRRGGGGARPGGAPGASGGAGSGKSSGGR